MTIFIAYKCLKPHVKTLVYSNKTATSETMSIQCESTRTLWSEEDGKVSVYFFMHANTAGHGSGRDFYCRGSFLNYVDNIRGVWGSKNVNSTFKLKNVHVDVGSWLKKGKLMSTWL